MPIEKKKNTLTVKTFFDGDQDATEIFVSLIADRVAADKTNKEIDYHENVIYNKIYKIGFASACFLDE